MATSKKSPCRRKRGADRRLESLHFNNGGTERPKKELLPLSSLSSSSSLSPLSCLFFLSSLPQVATGFCKNAPRVERKPCSQSVCAQGSSANPVCQSVFKPCQSVCWLCSKSRSCGSLAAFFVISSLFSLLSALFSLLTSLCALLSSLVSLLPTSK